MLYVDDSSDGTEDMILKVSGAASVPVAVIQRPVPRRGLSGAVVDGITASGSFRAFLIV